MFVYFSVTMPRKRGKQGKIPVKQLKETDCGNTFKG